jgi:hypothetical protein
VQTTRTCSVRTLVVSLNEGMQMLSGSIVTNPLNGPLVIDLRTRLGEPAGGANGTVFWVYSAVDPLVHVLFAPSVHVSAMFETKAGSPVQSVLVYFLQVINTGGVG